MSSDGRKYGDEHEEEGWKVECSENAERGHRDTPKE